MRRADFSRQSADSSITRLPFVVEKSAVRCSVNARAYGFMMVSKAHFQMFIPIAALLLSCGCFGCTLQTSQTTKTAAHVQTTASHSAVSNTNKIQQNQITTSHHVDSSQTHANAAQTPSVATPAPSLNVDDIDALRIKIDTECASNPSFALQSAAELYEQTHHDADKTRVYYAASLLSPNEQKQRIQDPNLTMFARAVLAKLALQNDLSQNDRNTLSEDMAILAPYLAGPEHENDLKQLQALTQQDQMPIVAVILPLSGKDRRIGRAMLGATLQAAGVYDHRALPFALRFFDSASTADSIPNIVAQIQSIGAKLVLGPVDITESMRAADALPNPILMIGFSPNDAFVGTRDHIFQVSYTITQEIQTISAAIASLGARTLHIAAPDDRYTSTTIDLLQNSLPAYVNVKQVRYPANQTDLRDIAHQIASDAPELILLPTSPENAERMSSFLAQENVWCQSPSTAQPTAQTDNRKFVSCLSTSAWAPIKKSHHYKFITNGIYLDYTDAANQRHADFETQFEALYHRLPAVHEILPFVVVSELRNIPKNAWFSPETLKSAVRTRFNGQKYLMMPTWRQLTAQGSVPFEWTTHAVSLPVRSMSVK